MGTKFDEVFGLDVGVRLRVFTSFKRHLSEESAGREDVPRMWI